MKQAAVDVGRAVLLLAVISTGEEPVALTPGVVRDAVRTDPHLAAGVLRVV